MQKYTNNLNDWKLLWEQYGQSYINSPPRTGIFLHAVIKEKFSSILELGAGSSRDSYFLADFHRATATDYEEQMVDLVKHNSKKPNFTAQKENSFNLSFKNKTFDYSFHNGLIVLFDEKDTLKIIREQSRVTKKTLFIIVHNFHNKKLVKCFKEKAQANKLYKIRFFSINDLENITKIFPEAKKIQIYKFGGPGDIAYPILKKTRLYDKVCSSAFFGKIMRMLYSLTPLHKAERLVLRVDL